MTCKPILLLLLLIWLMPCHRVSALDVQQAQQNSNPITITLVTDNNYMPYSFEQNGEAKGLLLDIVAMVDAQLQHFKIEVKQMPWRAAKNMVMKGEAQGILGSYFNVNEWPKIYPYSYPLFYENLVTICASSKNQQRIQESYKSDTLLDLQQASNPNVKPWPYAYAGEIVGTVNGYDGWTAAELRRDKDNQINFFEFPNARLALLGVYKEVVDCTLLEKANFVATQNSLIQAGEIESADLVQLTSFVSRHSVHIGYSERAFNNPHNTFIKDFKKAFDSTFIVMQQKGEFDNLLTTHLVTDQP